MNTFLPFPDYAQSAACLDKRRCFKQVVEASQILDVLEGRSQGWKNHPAVKMWRNYIPSLKQYYAACYDYCLVNHRINFCKLQPLLIDKYAPYPHWFGDDQFHLKMRQNLIRKAISDMSKNNPELYWCLSQHNITLQNTLPLEGYYWPLS